MAAGSRFCPICGELTDATTCPKHGALTVPAQPSAAPADQLPKGQVFAGRYKIQGVLGAGGMGRVYRAEQSELRRSVALKVLHQGFVSNEHYMVRFKREARAASRLNSPHVVRVYDFGIDEGSGTPFIVQERLHGHTLHEEITKVGAFPPRRAVAILLQVARALFDGEKAGIVHRDLKPENIFLVDTPDDADFVKVMDYGVARMEAGANDPTCANITAAGLQVGTPAFMAPEQVRGEPVDFRADLYALGCMMHELLTGEPPFGGSTRLAVLQAHLTEPLPALPNPLPRGFVPPPELVQLHARLLAKKKEERPSSGREVVDTLSRLGDELARTGGRPTRRPTSPGAETEAYDTVEPTPAPIPVVPARAPTTAPDEDSIRDAPTEHFAQASQAEMGQQAAIPAAPAPSAPAPTASPRQAGPAPILAASGESEDIRDKATAAMPEHKIAPLPANQPEKKPAPRSGTILTYTQMPVEPMWMTRLRDPRTLSIGGVVIAALVAIVLIIWLGSETPPEAPAAAPTAAAKPAAPASPADAPVPAPSAETGGAAKVRETAAEEEGEGATVSVSVVSEPTGATVLRDGEEVGSTPVELDVQRGSDPFAIELAHPRHRKATIKVVPDRDKEIHVELSAVVRATKTIIIEQPALPPRRDNKKMKELLD